MLRNILRTSRWLARTKISSFVPIVAPKILAKCSEVAMFPRPYCSGSDNPQLQTADHVDPVVFEQICSETLESLCEFFEELVESSSKFKGADVTYSDGVLTVDLGPAYGTYVINRQTPNKQIWLSSPTSGPKRYDLVLENSGYWIYKHDNVTLHKLLQSELSKITDTVDFSKCSHSVV